MRRNLNSGNKTRCKQHQQPDQFFIVNDVVGVAVDVLASFCMSVSSLSLSRFSLRVGVCFFVMNENSVCHVKNPRYALLCAGNRFYLYQGLYLLISLPFPHPLFLLPHEFISFPHSLYRNISHTHAHSLSVTDIDSFL